MEIIKIPHPSLRKKAAKVEFVDKKLRSFIADLEKTLDSTRNPRGVGLAAPQVDKLWRVFIVKLNRQFRPIINPVIKKHSKNQTLHESEGQPFLEGCLSMPKLWGPVPRWEWVELDFEIVDGDRLIRQTERFEGIDGRIVQHEYDHLEGVLFTDYSLKYDLPVYQEQDGRDHVIEVDREFLEMF